MSTNKHIDIICLVVTLLALLLGGIAVVFGTQAEAVGTAMPYEEKLFDSSYVHTLDIIIDDWEGFLETCTSEEYTPCSVVIDGEAFSNVGLRGKGNTSLSSVASMDSDRYSFKIEFDQYSSGGNYYGLDKLALNNLIQDNTMMKDHLTYRMMDEFGAAAPLSSYVYITVNGEDFGLYLAVEGVEDSFLTRNYGSSHGDLYKPDSMSMGGGRGNGKDFDFENFITAEEGQDFPFMPESRQQGEEDTAQMEIPTGIDSSTRVMRRPDAARAEMGGDIAERMGEGMGSSDTKLQYIDDDPDSYANIFSSAKTDVTTADQTRLIEALKALSEGTDIENTVDIDAAMRYFVVHNYVVNGDSYTGSMIHNYYLYEEDGLLSMLPWDYNLAFGGFQSSDASAAVNDPIDTPLSVSGNGDRPMADWIFANEEYTQLYHEYFSEFLKRVDIPSMIEETAALVAPYVERDPTKFCTYEEFDAGVDALVEFCKLRTQSVQEQLNGTIPSTDDGQREDSSTLVEAGTLTLSDMGSMGMGGGGNRGGMDRGQMTPFELQAENEAFPTPAGEGSTDLETPTERPQGFSEAMPEMPTEDLRPEGGERVTQQQFRQGDMQALNSRPFQQMQPASDNIASLWLLCASFAMLLAGLAAALFYKRR